MRIPNVADIVVSEGEGKALLVLVRGPVVKVEDLLRIGPLLAHEGSTRSISWEAVGGSYDYCRILGSQRSGHGGKGCGYGSDRRIGRDDSLRSGQGGGPGSNPDDDLESSLDLHQILWLLRYVVGDDVIELASTAWKMKSELRLSS
ncbi:hypothetical protein ACLOJK_037471 [Asimina triloba]